MPSIKDPGPTTTEGSITFADVLSAVPIDSATGALLPGQTNAAAIRDKLGRGSRSTIQKHLDAIRAELSAAAAPAPGAIPDAPKELVATLWAHAWSALQAQTMGRHDQLVIERDALRVRVEELSGDVQALAGQADALGEEVQRLKTEAGTAASAATEALAHATAEARRLAAELDAERKAAELAAERAAHAAESAQKDFEIERQTLRAEIHRLSERVAELRALEIFAAGRVPPVAE